MDLPYNPIVLSPERCNELILEASKLCDGQGIYAFALSAAILGCIITIILNERKEWVMLVAFFSLPLAMALVIILAVSEGFL